MNKYKFIDQDGEHLHKLGDRPLIGTSSVTGVLNKPLTWWASGLAVKTLGWVKALDTRKSTKDEVELNKKERLATATPMLTKIKFMSVEDYLKLLDTAYKAHSVRLKDAAEKGTDTHQLCEDFIKGKPGDYTAIKPFTDWAKDNVDKWLWSEAHCFSESLWVGGICDAGYLSKDGRVGIIDFKSHKEAYNSDFYQIGLYDMQISENGWYDKDGDLLGKLDKPIDHYVVFPFGMKDCKAQYNYNIDKVKSGSMACLTLYKLDLN